jgi:hypothetical protein
MLMILEGKVNLYKRGYHVVLRRLRQIHKENKMLKKEVAHLNNVLRIHEDLMFASLEYV